MTYIEQETLLNELVTNQLKEVDPSFKLRINDMKRIASFLNTSIFKNECSIWTGYVYIIKYHGTNKYIDFFLKRKKSSLMRILYRNFVGPLEKSEYLKHTCQNQEICCSIKHITKHTNGQTNKTTFGKQLEVYNECREKHINNKNTIKVEHGSFVVDFTI